MTTLSIRLGDSDFFYGSQPNMLDLIVYANLAPILKIPLSTCSLQNHLRQCNNLVQLINRISQKYFAINLQDYERTKLNETKRAPKAEDIDFPHKRRDQILAGVFATVAMTTYALSTGIVEVNIFCLDLIHFLKKDKKLRIDFLCAKFIIYLIISL